jgi:hypothetical protein
MISALSISTLAAPQPMAAADTPIYNYNGGKVK